MLKNSKGYALVIVLILMLVMALVGATLLTTSLSDTRLTVAQVKNKQAYYAARSGADAMATYIIKNSSKLQDLITNTNPTSAYATGTIGTNASFKVKVMNGVTAGDILIKSTGIVSGGQSANVSLTLTQTTNEFSNITVFSENAPNLNKSTIVGNLTTRASSINKPDQVTGTITYNSPISLPPADVKKFPNEYKSSYILKDGDKIYANIDTLNDSIIKDIKSSINIASNPEALAELHLYVNTTLNLSSVNPPDGVAVFIYYNGTEKAPKQSNGGFDMKQCLFYLPNTSFDINGGGNGTYYGTIIAKECNFPNSHGKFTPDSIVDSSHMVGGSVGYVRGTWGN